VRWIQPGNSRAKSVLFLAAEPIDTVRLRIGQEVREIHERLQLARRRREFVLHQRFSVRATDISQALLDLDPHVVHFSGHGTAAGQICLEDEGGSVRPVPPAALGALFGHFRGAVRCVVLNACFSRAQAQAISENIEFVIGMQQAVADRAAIAFSIGFYQALGAGRTPREAFGLGVVQVRLQGLEQGFAPVLMCRHQAVAHHDPVGRGA
jgi:hypothetical protein